MSVHRNDFRPVVGDIVTIKNTTKSLSSFGNGRRYKVVGLCNLSGPRLEPLTPFTWDDSGLAEHKYSPGSGFSWPVNELEVETNNEYPLGSVWRDRKSANQYSLVRTCETAYGKRCGTKEQKRQEHYRTDKNRVCLIETRLINSHPGHNPIHNSMHVESAESITASEFTNLSGSLGGRLKLVVLAREFADGDTVEKTSDYLRYHGGKVIALMPTGLYKVRWPNGKPSYLEAKSLRLEGTTNKEPIRLTKGPLKTGRWYRVKSGPFGGLALKALHTSNGRWADFRHNDCPRAIHMDCLTRLSYHSKEVQEQIKQKETVMNPDYNKTHGYVCADKVGYGAKESLEKANKPPAPIAAGAGLKKVSKDPEVIEALVEKVTDRNMAELRAVATSYVGTESNKRIERVKYDLLEATEANILEIEAIKAGIKQPRKVNWPAIVVGVIGVVTTIAALCV